MGTTSRKKDAIRDDFGHLPPEQRRKAIQKKISELQEQHDKAEKSIMATQKTIDLYRDQPQFGDAKTIAAAEGEISGLEKEREKLANELYKFQLYLCTIDKSEPPVPPTGYKEVTAMLGDEDNISVMSHDSYASGHSHNPFPSPAQASPSAAAATPDANSFAAPVSQQAEGDEEDDFDNWSDEDEGQVMADPLAESTAADPAPPPAAPAVDAVPTVGTARALYDFPGTNPGEMAMQANEELQVVALDDGSGWVRVLKNGAQGYCPASYIEMTSSDS